MFNYFYKFFILVCNTNFCVFLGPSGRKKVASGVLHVKVGIAVGTVCDDGFGFTEAMAICEELGFQYVRQV